DPRLEKPFGHWIFPGQQFAIPGAEPPEPDLKQEAIRRMLEVKERQLAPEAPAPPVNAINRFLEASKTKVDTVTGAVPKVVAPEVTPEKPVVDTFLEKPIQPAPKAAADRPAAKKPDPKQAAKWLKVVGQSLGLGVVETSKSIVNI